MRRAVAALPVALALAACGPLIPLPPADRADVVEPADAGAADAPVIDAAVCTYPLRVGCTGPAGCAGFRECDPTETFLGPCTCYADAGWDRPPPADVPAAEDRPVPADQVRVDAPSDVPAAEDRPAPADAAAPEDRPPPADVPVISTCLSHPPECRSNAECAVCPATVEGVPFCCSQTNGRCYLRPVTRCMP